MGRARLPSKSTTCTNVTAVDGATACAYAEGTQYVLGPDRELRKYWVELPPARPTCSTEMGFT